MKINILLKKPAKGGIPHIENIIKENESASWGFEINKPDKSLIYFILLKLPCFLIESKIENVATVMIIYIIT